MQGPDSVDKGQCGVDERVNHQREEKGNREGSGAHLILSATRVIGRQPRRNRESKAVLPSTARFHCFVSSYGVATMSLYSLRGGD